jgi:hypothetical protein
MSPVDEHSCVRLDPYGGANPLDAAVPVEQIYASDKEIEAVFETLAPINSASGLRALVSAGSSADWLW